MGDWVGNLVTSALEWLSQDRMLGPSNLRRQGCR
jgi:hypothetical protein